MKTINELQDEIIEEFAVFDDWMDKYSLLIDMGRNLTPLDESLKTPDNRIEGCQSNVWLDARMRDDLLIFTADSDAVLVKGIVSVLVQILSGHTPEEVLEAELYCIERIGLKEHLSPTRSNGLLAMVKQMKMYALAFQARNKA
ncbi:MAG: SufE family protein [Paludibacteraceae bacterium]|nr:SufE family protein [Paludibacteraceae bacterium]